MPNETYLEFMIFVNKALEFKEKSNLTYQEIGEAIGVNRSHVQRVFNMQTFPSFQFLIRLAHFMKIPLFSLLIPSEKLLQQDLANKINSRLKELNWNTDDLSNNTGISLLHLNDILNAETPLTDAERTTIIEVLDIEDEFTSLEIKENLLKGILADMGLNANQIDNIVKYVNDSLK